MNSDSVLPQQLTDSLASRNTDIFFGVRFLTFPVLIALITLVGFLIRLSFLNETIYNADEAYVTIFASKAANFWALESWRDFPFTGLKTSFGFRNPPLFIYLLAPFFVFTTDPRFAMVGLITLGSVAIALFGFTARRLLTPKAGLIAALMVAFLPNAVQHCRQLWGHDVQLFFAALCFFATERSLRDYRARWFIISILSAAFAQACHLSGMFLWCLPTFAALSFPKTKFIRIVGAEILIVIFVYLPWLAEEAGWTVATPRPDGNFANTKLMISIFTGGGNSTPVETPFHPFWGWFGVLTDSFRLDIIGGYYFETYYENPTLASLMLIFQYGLGVLMILGLLMMAKDAKSSQTPMLFWGIITTSITPMITFSLLPVSSVPLYQLPAFFPGCFAVLYFIYRMPDALQSISRELLPQQQIRTVALTVLLILVVGGGSIHALRTSIVRSKANFTQDLPTTFETKFNTILLCFTVAEVNEGLARNQYTITQNGRSPEAGVDVWIAALSYSITGERALPYNPDADQAFLLVDNEAILREPLQVFLNRFDYTPIKTIRVYRLFGNELQAWRRLTRQFPSVKPEAIAEQN